MELFGWPCASLFVRCYLYRESLQRVESLIPTIYKNWELRRHSYHLHYPFSKIIQPFVTNTNININIHTSCIGLMNRVTKDYANTPSNVLADHMDIIYQIRAVIKTLPFKSHFIHTQSPKLDLLDRATPPERNIHSLHNTALTYFRSPDFHSPNTIQLLFPDKKYTSYINTNQ